MIDAIKALAKETNTDWFSIVLALNDRNILTCDQIKKIEDYFFDFLNRRYGHSIPLDLFQGFH